MQRTGRRPRNHRANSIHHVMMRGNNRQKIFYGENYFTHFLDIVSESTEKFDHKILAYCLMSNHIHLIVHVQKNSLSTIMQNINFRYARWTNHKLKHIGHLFQGRYRSLDVDDDEYLVNLCHYIHFNPVAANIVTKPAQYQWSSHRYYTSKIVPQWLDVDFITRTIKSKTGLGYNEYINQELDREKWKPALFQNETGEFVIDDSLMKAASESFSTPTPSIHKQFLAVEDVTRIVCYYLEIQPNELFSPGKNHKLSKKRALVITFLLKYCSINMSQVANLFQRTQATLSRQVIKAKNSLDEYFSKELLKSIDIEIKRNQKILE